MCLLQYMYNNNYYVNNPQHFKLISMRQAVTKTSKVHDWTETDHLNVVLKLTSHAWFLFSLCPFPELLEVRLLHVRPVLESKLLGFVVTELLHTRCTSCHPTQQHQKHWCSINHSLTYLLTEGWQYCWLGTACCHYADKIVQEHRDGWIQEHRDGWMGCLALQLYGSLPAVTITVLNCCIL